MQEDHLHGDIGRCEHVASFQKLYFLGVGSEILNDIPFILSSPGSQIYKKKIQGMTLYLINALELVNPDIRELI